MAVKQKAKRNKAYRPKKVGNDALGMSALTKSLIGITRKKYHLTMSWDLFDVDRTLDMYCLMNDIDPNDKGPLPVNILQMVYKGNLIVALREDLIDAVQGFYIEIKAKAKNAEGHVIDAPFFRMSFKDKPIDYNIFMRGKDAGKYYFKRDGVFSVLWEGITEEWNKHLATDGKDDYVVFEATGYLSCDAYFLSLQHERKFKRLDQMNPARRLQAQ